MKGVFDWMPAFAGMTLLINGVMDTETSIQSDRTLITRMTPILTMAAEPWMPTFTL
jgi:hypothetical protein